jgi:murein DD-endopeptidase MepM/ murein hydrolase activator NlpD
MYKHLNDKLGFQSDIVINILQKLKIFTSYILVIVCLCANIYISIYNKTEIQVYTQTKTRETISAEYKKKADEIEQSKNLVEKDLNNAAAKFTHLGTKRKTLKEELEARKKDIQELEEKIKITDLITQRIKEQQDVLNKEIEKLAVEQGLLLRQVQVENRVPLIALALEGNVIKGFEKYLRYNLLMEQVAKVSEKIKLTRVEFDKSLASQQEVRQQQESIKTLLSGQVSYNAELAKQTEEEYSKTQKEIEELNKKSQEYIASLKQNGVDLAADIASLEAAEKAKLRTQGPAYIPPASSGCRNETDGLKVERDELAPVTSGVIMQLMTCPSGGYMYHDGIDISSSYGTPIYSAGNGTVIKRCVYFSSNGCVGQLGYHLAIQTELKSGQTFIAVYGHMSSLEVAEGQRVTRGQRIGRMGSTGNSTGSHLHFTMTATGSEAIMCYSYSPPAPNTKCYNPLRYVPNANRG